MSSSNSPSRSPPAGPMPSTIFCSAVLAPYARSIASRMAGAGATYSLTVTPRVCCRSSSNWGLVGSAVATISVEPSMAIGQATYWRRYLGERFLSARGVEGSSSPERKGNPCCSASARNTSVAVAAPRAISTSPRRRWS